MAITKQNFLQFSSELDAALAELGAKYGVVLKGGNAKIDSMSGIVDMKLHASPIAADGNVVTKEAADFKLYARSYGLDASDLNKEIIYAGKRYEIAGAKPQSYKFPILAKNLIDGKLYKLPSEGVKKALGK